MGGGGADSNPMLSRCFITIQFISIEPDVESPLYDNRCGTVGGSGVGQSTAKSLSVISRYTDFSTHSQFAPFFSETFRPYLILRKDVSLPPHK